MSVGFEILIIFVLIILNGVFVISEIAVLSSRKARLQQRVNEGDPGAKAALNLAENPNIFLSTTQVGITLIGVLTGAVGGATIADALSIQFEAIPRFGCGGVQPTSHHQGSEGRQKAHVDINPKLNPIDVDSRKLRRLDISP